MSMSDTSIRPLGVSDAARICELSRQLGYSARERVMTRRIAQLAKTDGHWLLGAQVQDAIAGFIHFYQRPSIETGTGLVVQSLIVDETIRGRGLGRILLSEAEGVGHALGIGFVVLSSRLEREDAHAFYIRRGYVVSATSVYFRKVLDRPPD